MEHFQLIQESAQAERQQAGVAMPRMKHKEVLTAIRAAGYHGDKERGMLLYVQNWISLSAFGRAYEMGALMRQSGLPCDCPQCCNHAPKLQDLAAPRFVA